MKKVSKARPPAAAPVQPSDDPDDIPDDFDFSKAVRVAPPRRLQEGERVYINDAPFIVRGHGFVPAPEETPGPDVNRDEESH